MKKASLALKGGGKATGFDGGREVVKFNYLSLSQLR